jgi:hypothetical protein
MSSVLSAFPVAITRMIYRLLSLCPMAVQMAQMAAFPITRIVNFMVIGGMADVIDARDIGSLARFTAVIVSVLATVAVGSLAGFTRGYFIADFVRMRVVMVILAFEGAILRILVREEDKNSEDERHIVKIYSHNYACAFTHLN